MSDQLIHQRNLFVGSNAETIAILKSELIDASKAFLEVVRNNYTTDQASKLDQFLMANDLSSFATLLRWMDNSFLENGMRKIFWCVIDGINFLLDAIGLHWKYLTPEGRLQYLVFSRQEIDSIKIDLAR